MSFNDSHPITVAGATAAPTPELIESLTAHYKQEDPEATPEACGERAQKALKGCAAAAEIRHRAGQQSE